MIKSSKSPWKGFGSFSLALSERVPNPHILVRNSHQGSLCALGWEIAAAFRRLPCWLAGRKVVGRWLSLTPITLARVP